MKDVYVCWIQKGVFYQNFKISNNDTWINLFNQFFKTTDIDEPTYSINFFKYQLLDEPTYLINFLKLIDMLNMHWFYCKLMKF